MNKNKHISVLLMGGLGNQIFQFCIAKNFEEKGYKVTIDTSNFDKFKNAKTFPFLHREQIFPIEFFGFQETKRSIKLTYNFFEKLKKYHLFPKYLSFTKEINDYNYRDYKFSKINKAIGYWQDTELIKNYKNYIKESISNNEELSKSLRREAQPGSTVLHIRRGDYLNMDEALSESFYKEAIKFCQKNIKNFKFHIFTDDYEWAKDKKLFKGAEKIHSDEISISNTIDTFSKMLSNENFIIGNSTFSLIAALLVGKKNSKIIVADPWFRNKDRNLNFDKSWVHINNSK